MIAKVGREKLAALIDTTRAHVGLFMAKFRRLGFIEYDDSGLRVHASLLNMVLRDDLPKVGNKN